MSLLPRLRLVGLRSAYQRACEYFAPAKRPLKGARRTRRLCIDPLEERQLLTVTADTGLTIASSLAANNYLNSSSSSDIASVATVSSQAVATDDSGDEVVTWTQTDPVWDAELNQYIYDQNIYAEYLTHDTQQISLDPNATSFYLVYGGTTITQKLSFNQSSTSNSDIAGNVTLTFGAYSITVNYDSSTSYYETFASNLQSALQASGNSQLADAVVTPIDNQNFTIEFSATSPTLLAVDQANTTLTTGYLASASISSVNMPVIIGKIKVSSSNPNSTIASIVSYMEGQTATTIETAPTTPLPTTQTVTTSTGLSVAVTSVATADDPNGLYHFQITFDNDAGYAQLAPLAIVNAMDASGNDVTGNCSVTILKESSGTFRVNPTEIDDPATRGLDLTDQFSSVVAMDGDGSFIISWINTEANGETDVDARRFTTRAYTDSTANDWAYVSLTDSYIDANGDLVAEYSAPEYVNCVVPVSAPRVWQT